MQQFSLPDVHSQFSIPTDEILLIETSSSSLVHDRQQNYKV